MHVESRKAQVSDKLTSQDFGMGTKGFSASENSAVAVCLLPGTEIAFAEPVQVNASQRWDPQHETTTICRGRTINDQVAIFRQINKDCSHMHHDALEFGKGDFVLLTDLAAGQKATVLQLPARPTNLQEEKDQERLSVSA